MVFKPNEKAYTEMTWIKVFEKQVFSIPLVSGNRIYIKDAETLTCYQIE
jgi:hypothetical protein